MTGDTDVKATTHWTVMQREFDLESHSHITWVMSHITWVMSHITWVMLCCAAVKHVVHEPHNYWSTVTHSLGHKILTHSLIINVMSFFACNDTYITWTGSSQSTTIHTHTLHVLCHSLLMCHSDTILGACYS